LVGAGLHHVWGGLMGGGLAGLVVWPHVRRADRQAAIKAEETAEAAFTAARTTWTAAATGAAFAAIRQRCLEAKTSLEGLPAERAARLASLQSEAKQLEAFLDRFRIVKGQIAGVGAGRIASLNSFGVETAWDIDARRIRAIPGFGPSTAEKLVAWRKSKEAGFRFNPSHPIAAAELNAIDSEFSAKTQQCVGVLRSGPSLLRQASEEAVKAEAATGPLVQERWTAWQLAKRRRHDLYDEIGSSNPVVLAMAVITAIFVLIVLQSQMQTSSSAPGGPAAPRLEPHNGR
jgi:hypothetical protein